MAGPAVRASKRPPVRWPWSLIVESMDEGRAGIARALLRKWSLSGTDIRKIASAGLSHSRFTVPSESVPSKPPAQSPLCNRRCALGRLTGAQSSPWLPFWRRSACRLGAVSRSASLRWDSSFAAWIFPSHAEYGLAAPALLLPLIRRATPRRESVSRQAKVILRRTRPDASLCRDEVHRANRTKFNQRGCKAQAILEF
jgi:hypothetical protein